MATWYEEAVFYHMYPIGMTGAPRQNTEEGIVHRFEQLDKWLPHIAEIGCTAIYIARYLNLLPMAMIPGIIKWWIVV